MTIHRCTNVLAVTLMVLLAASFASAQLIQNCGNEAGCRNFAVTATGGTLFQHNDQSHDGNGNLTSFNNAAISTSSATGFTSPATVNSGKSFRGKNYCDTTGVLCPLGTNLGRFQIGTGLPTNSPYNIPQNMSYFSDVFNSTYSTLAITGYPGAPECGGVTNATAVNLLNAPCGSFVAVDTNGACAKFGTNSQGDTVPACHGNSGYTTNDWCATDGSVPCAFIGRFKPNTDITFQTQPNGTSVLSGTVIGIIPQQSNGNFWRVNCTLTLTTAADFAAWINGHETIQTATINDCN